MSNLVKTNNHFSHELFGSLTTITNDAGDVFFVAKEVATTLGYSNPHEAIRTHCKGVSEILTPTKGGEQMVKIIPERDLYRLIIKSKKPEAEKFEEWVVGDVLPTIRKKGSYNSNDLKRFLDIEVQKGYSKSINKANYEKSGVTGTIEYNKNNCLYHTGKTPAQIIARAKDYGLKSKQRTSAKEALRAVRPEIACAMSLTDKLVAEDNIEHRIAAQTCKEYATPLFQQLMKIGLSQSELEKLA